LLKGDNFLSDELSSFDFVANTEVPVQHGEGMLILS
jgi:hypothetical protein